MVHLNSSLRIRSAKDSFVIAQKYFEKLGISRVSETTRLDRIGMPVAIAVRPSASKDSLILTAGKGIEPMEAMVGAAMESIEIAFSDAKHSQLKTEQHSAHRILNSVSVAADILRLCPILGQEIDLEKDMSMVQIGDLLSSKKRYIPSELLFVPFVPQPHESKHFGFHTNGLASGNSFEEAIIHAIFEIIERDILSFEFVYEKALHVQFETLPTQAQSLIKKIEQEGLKVIIKTVLSAHEIPFFKAYILDEWAANPTNLNAGYGCHGHPEIALMRALSEAAQSRMSYIHGGREDLTKGHKPYENEKNMRSINQNIQKSMDASKGSISFEAISGVAINATEIDQYLTALLSFVKNRKLIKEIYVARHTRVEDELQVVKVVVPEMEFYNHETNRIGPRLHAYIKKLAL